MVLPDHPTPIPLRTHTADFFGVTIEELFIREHREDSAEPDAVQ